MVQRHEATSTRLQQSPEEGLRIRTKTASGVKRGRRGEWYKERKQAKRKGRNNGEIKT